MLSLLGGVVVMAMRCVCVDDGDPTYSHSFDFFLKAMRTVLVNVVLVVHRAMLE